MLENYDEPVVKPPTMAEKILLILKNNRAYMALLVLLLAGVIILALSLNSCPQGGFSVSVPEEWLDDYYAHYKEGQGSDSYSFFANMVRSLTQKPFVTYDLNELDTPNYAEAREDYLWNESNLDRPTFLRTYPMPNNEVNHDLAILRDLPNPPGTQEYRNMFLDNLARMSRYGVYSYTGMDRYRDFGPDSTGISYFFANASAFNQDSEILLNMFLPLRQEVPGTPYEINTRESRPNSRRLALTLQGGVQGYNTDLLFRGSATTRNDVVNRKSAIGFYLKYKNDRSSGNARARQKIEEKELDVGKVYMIWSPNITRRELLWLYNEYLGPAAEAFHAQSPFVSLNHHWLPDKYPFQAEEVVSALAKVDQEKLALQKAASGKTYQIYYDHNDIRDYVDLVAARSNNRAKLVKAKVMPPQTVLSEMKTNAQPIIYVYGVSLHSIYNLPTEVISRSFWFNAESGGDLYGDIAQHIKTFGLKINTSGQIDPREFSQYADLERELTIGTRENSNGGLFPLFTVPYVMVYNRDSVGDIHFNTTRGFLQLTSTKPLRSGRRSRK